MSIFSELRTLTNRFLRPFDLVLERKSRIQRIQDRFVLRPSLFERAIRNKESAVFIDIGASVGNTVGAVLDLCPSATVYAFEPQLDQAMSISSRFSMNPNVHVCPLGIGSDQRKLPLHVTQRKQCSSFLRTSGLGMRVAPFAREETTLESEIISLDYWYSTLKMPPTCIDLIKVDTQGFEKEIIAGGKLVFSKTACVILETGLHAIYEGEAVYEELLPLMKEMGFIVTAVAPSYFNSEDFGLVQVDILFQRDN